MHIPGIRVAPPTPFTRSSAADEPDVAPAPRDEFRVAAVELDGLYSRRLPFSAAPAVEADDCSLTPEPSAPTHPPLRVYADLPLRMMLAQHSIYLDEAGLRQVAPPGKD